MHCCIELIFERNSSVSQIGLMDVNHSCSVCMKECSADFIDWNCCDHCYHKSCIADWLKNNYGCPICTQQKIGCFQPLEIFILKDEGEDVDSVAELSASDREQAVVMLSACNGNIDTAVEQLSQLKDEDKKKVKIQLVKRHLNTGVEDKFIEQILELYNDDIIQTVNHIRNFVTVMSLSQDKSIFI